jgi:hypothetical protein
MEALRDLGFPGAVISALVGAIGVLSTAVVTLWKQNGRITQARFADHAVLLKAVADTVTALNNMAEATDDRNRTSIELAQLISTWGAAFQVFQERMGNQHEGNLERLRDMKQVFDAMSQSMRVIEGQLRDLFEKVTRSRR